MQARAVIVAGPSGSGKSHLAARLGWPVLRLDDFYYDADHPSLPMSPLGLPDWDDVRSWDRDEAIRAMEELCRTRATSVPVYDLSRSARIGSHRVEVVGDRFIAEGLFAPDIVAACRERGLLADAICLVRPRLLTFALRLARDLRESRKPPGVLLRRGWALMSTEQAVVARAVAAGCRPLTPARARRELTASL
ncbi:ATP-binding protein [Aeromicrobium sp. PE09-221]|uniref:uridine kinase family protein n=1 Tax=Aeromicrobium sp. PE09-221 TaxID=1898043 RepID=UPI000B3E523A|nr:ATP-binding protein [Aeromicrobium sp. PE09-221]OUZ11048.1 ATP-binding protein [Aeromicrobium sp. PE09-221]